LREFLARIRRVCPIARTIPGAFLETAGAIWEIRRAIALHFVANDYLCLNKTHDTLKHLTFARFLYLIKISEGNSGGMDTPLANMNPFLVFLLIDEEPQEIWHG
jgi:hypothetical protein